MGYSVEQTYAVAGLIIDGERIEFAMIKGGSSPFDGKWRVAVHAGCDPATSNEGGCKLQDHDKFWDALKAYNEGFSRFLVGKRVRLTKDCGSIVIGSIGPGLTGTVYEFDGHVIAVKLDERFPSLDEWDNNLHFNSEAWTDENGREFPTIEDFLDSVEFIDGDVLPVA